MKLPKLLFLSCLFLRPILLTQAQQELPAQSSRYITNDPVHLGKKIITEDALQLLKNYCSASSWMSIRKALNTMAQDANLRVVFLGETHSLSQFYASANQEIVSVSMEILRRNGYSMLFIEEDFHYQALIDSYLGGMEEMDPKIADWKRVLEKAKSLGMQVIAMDFKKADDRDLAMFQVVSQYLRQRPQEKAILYGGAAHARYKKHPYKGITAPHPLGELLQSEHGAGLLLINLVGISGLNEYIQGYGGRLNLLGKALRTRPSPISDVPVTWPYTTIQWYDPYFVDTYGDVNFIFVLPIHVLPASWSSNEHTIFRASPDL